MPKLPNETDYEYRQRVLDTKSDSFCGAKYFNATIWLGSGQTTSCHHPLPHQVSLDEIAVNPKALHNTCQKKAERALMKQGDRPEGCNYCWTIEDLKFDAISDRVYKSVIYSDDDLEAVFEAPAEQDFDLQTLEISFDRTCQFACSYCNPAFSSTWVKDIETNGAYTDLVSDGRNHFTHTHPSSQLYKYGEQNPYVDAFFKWWASDLHRSLKELRITGGEPLMSGHTWKVIEWFKSNKTNMKFALNSNLGVSPDRIQQLLKASKLIKHFHLYTSNESTGAYAEYIRDGLSWKDWVSNVGMLLKTKSLEGFHMMCTINALCLVDLVHFLNWCLDIKSLYGRDFPTISLNILRFPSFQSVLVLPPEIRNTYWLQLSEWYEINKDNALLHQFELNQVRRLIDYIDPTAFPAKPHCGSSDIDTLRSDFKKFYIQYDLRRGKDFAATFPQLADWYNSL